MRVTLRPEKSLFERFGMLKKAPSAEQLRRLNRRQRKKHRVGEFQEFLFEVRVTFRQPLDEPAYDPVIDDFIEMIESRQLVVGGMGGTLPLASTDGMVSAARRGSPTQDDPSAVVTWLQQRAEVAGAEVGEFVDGWYG